MKLNKPSVDVRVVLSSRVGMGQYTKQFLRAGCCLVLFASSPEIILLCQHNNGCAWYTEIRLVCIPLLVSVSPCMVV